MQLIEINSFRLLARGLFDIDNHDQQIGLGRIALQRLFQLRNGDDLELRLAPVHGEIAEDQRRPDAKAPLERKPCRSLMQIRQHLAESMLAAMVVIFAHQRTGRVDQPDP